MIDPTHKLPIVRQAQLLAVSRAAVYYLPQATPAADLALMRHIDALHLDHPSAGSRMLRDMLRRQGFAVGRKHVAMLMRGCGLSANQPYCDGTHKKTLDEKEGTLCWYDADVVRHELTGAFPNIRTPSE